VISSSLVVFIAPKAAGSGIPNTIAYLNGVDDLGLFNFTTLIVTAISTVLSVACGLRIGKEGPIVHMGAICGLLTLYYLPWSYKWQNDKFKWILVAGGASAGLAVSFGTPIAGVLFIYEISRS